MSRPGLTAEEIGTIGQQIPRDRVEFWGAAGCFCKFWFRAPFWVDIYIYMYICNIYIYTYIHMVVI